MAEINTDPANQDPQEPAGAAPQPDTPAAAAGADAPDGAGTGEPDAEPRKDMETRLAEALADVARLKREKDKASTEAAKYKKEAMSNKTEAEQKAIEKAEEDAKIRAELDELRRESAISKYTKGWMTCGMNEKAAAQAAEALYSGEVDTLFPIIKNHLAEREKEIKAELMRSLPSPNIGNDEGISITQEQFNAMGYKERLELFQNHPKVYEQLVK